MAALLGLAVGAGSAWWPFSEDDDAKALRYARKACDGVNLDGPAVTPETTSEASDQADSWRSATDDAARAARLDPAWNELARAMDIQLRGWKLLSQDNPPQAEVDALMAQSTAHPFEPECRKALVD